MAGANVADFGPLPGYVDNTAYDNVPSSGTASGATKSGPVPQSIIRMAWLIIIVSLIGLWLMGTLIFKRGG